MIIVENVSYPKCFLSKRHNTNNILHKVNGDHSKCGTGTPVAIGGGILGELFNPQASYIILLNAEVYDLEAKKYRHIKQTLGQ